MKFIGKIFFLTFITIFSSPVFASGSTDIDLNIYTHDGSFYSGKVSVSACSAIEDGSSVSINAFCAIEKVAGENNWQINKTWYPFGVTLDGLHTYLADFSNNRFWVYFVNGEPGSVGLNAYILQPNDKIDLFYGVSPLKTSVAKSNLKIGESVAVNVDAFDFMIWNWVKPQNVKFFVNNNFYSDRNDGILDFTPTDSGNYEIFANGDGFVKSNIINISASSEGNVTSSPSPAGGGCSYCVEISHQKQLKTFDSKNASDFLANNIFNSFVLKNMIVGDWAGIALSSLPSDDANILKLKQFLISNPLAENSLITDYERRAMTLMSLGIDPYNAGLNYIEKITSSYIGEQFGSLDMFNDDIFAIITLTKAGFSKDEPMIKNSLDFLIRAQNIEDGSWQNNIDLTSASISAISLFKGNRREDDVLKRAVDYLRKSQKVDGGFGDPFSTSWAIQAIYEYGEDPKTWLKSGKNPLDYLALLQDSDGGIKLSDGYIENRIWATAYALPGVEGRTWSKTLKYFNKPLAKETDLGENIFADVSTSLSTTTPLVLKEIPVKTPSPKSLQSKKQPVVNNRNQASVSAIYSTTSVNTERNNQNIFNYVIQKIGSLFRKIF